jgi:hypothetical protein
LGVEAELVEQAGSFSRIRSADTGPTLLREHLAGRGGDRRSAPLLGPEPGLVDQRLELREAVSA